MKKIDHETVVMNMTYMMARARAVALSQKLRMTLKNKVSYGPFKGMVLPAISKEEKKYGRTDAPKLLGCYEKELHWSLEKAIQRKPDIIVNVGAAEGYYAVGLARRLPQAEVIAFEMDSEAQKLCALAIKENDVGGRVHLRQQCRDGDLLEFVESNKKVLIVMDCGGEEMKLINKRSIDSLAKCDLIIECHDFVEREITSRLLELLKASHGVETIDECGRDVTLYPFLCDVSTLDRYLLVCEFRHQVMHWLACWSKNLCRSSTQGSALSAPCC